MSNFYNSVPMWMVKSVHGKLCNKCDNVLKKENITGIGILDNEIATLFVEFICPSCKYASRITFSGEKKGSVEQMCYFILEEIQNKRRTSRSRKIAKISSEVKGEMTDTEVGEFINKMNSSESYNEFLKLIGAKTYK